MEPSAAELFAVYKAHSLETMTARGTLFSPKQAPTVVEHWKELEPYLDRVGTRHTPAQTAHLARVKEHMFGLMSGTLEEASFLALFCNMCGYKRFVEVGTFLGLTSLVLAESLPEDARIITIDIGDEFLSIAKQGWSEAGVSHKIESRIQPGAAALRDLLKEKGPESFDVVFIDADKPSYDEYYELALQLVRRGGAVLVDNTLWFGRVANDNDNSEDTRVIRALNEKIHKDARIEYSIVPFADGVTICHKK